MFEIIMILKGGKFYPFHSLFLRNSEYFLDKLPHKHLLLTIDPRRAKPFSYEMGDFNFICSDFIECSTRIKLHCLYVCKFRKSSWIIRGRTILYLK